MHDPSEDTPSHHEEQPDTAGAGHEAGHPSPSANTALSDISLNDESASPHAATGSIKLPSEHESLSRTERANTPSFGAEVATVSPTTTFEPTPTPPVSSSDTTLMPAHDDKVNPVPVVQVLSVRGVEYFLFTVMLWSAAIDLGWILLALVNGGAHFDILAYPVASLIVGLPIFGFLFLRLKEAELANPQLKLEPSKRRLTQITQIVSFLVCFFNLVAFVYLILSKVSGQLQMSFGKMCLDVLIILVIAGGILAYYWHDEHKGR